MGSSFKDPDPSEAPELSADVLSDGLSRRRSAVNDLFGVPLAVRNLPAVFDAAERNGWKHFAASTFSHVLIQNDTVVKIFRDPAYLDFIEMFDQSNPAYPRLLDDVRFGDNLHAVFLERLDPVTYDADIETIEAVAQLPYRYGTVNEQHNEQHNALRRFATRFGTEAYQALCDIVTLAHQKGHTLDIHPKNVLIRSTAEGSQLVFVDPVACSHAPELNRSYEHVQPPGHIQTPGHIQGLARRGGLP